MSTARGVKEFVRRFGGQSIGTPGTYLRSQLASRKLIAKLQTEALRAAQARYKDVDESEIRYTKYLNLQKWIPETLERFYLLRLDQSPPLRILDIGTGTGYFPLVCEQHGHSAQGLDIDIHPVLNEVAEILGIRRKVWTINAFEPLPNLDTRFDLVTAFMVCFNQHNQPGLWQAAEWEFFLTDLATNHLSDHGRVVLWLNRERKTKAWYTPELRQFFLERGARVRHRAVEFPNLDSFRGGSQSRPGAKSGSWLAGDSGA